MFGEAAVHACEPGRGSGHERFAAARRESSSRYPPAQHTRKDGAPPQGTAPFLGRGITAQDIGRDGLSCAGGAGLCALSGRDLLRQSMSY